MSLLPIWSLEFLPAEQNLSVDKILSGGPSPSSNLFRRHQLDLIATGDGVLEVRALRSHGPDFPFRVHRQEGHSGWVLAAADGGRDHPLGGQFDRFLRRLSGPHLLDDVQAIDKKVGREPQLNWNSVLAANTWQDGARLALNSSAFRACRK